MEHNKREKIMAYVSQYAIITLSITIMSVGVYFFKFPNNFVFGGVTGAAALVAKLTPLSAAAFSSCPATSPMTSAVSPFGRGKTSYQSPPAWVPSAPGR